HLYSWLKCQFEPESSLALQIERALAAPCTRDLSKEISRTRVLLEAMKGADCNVEDATLLLDQAESGEVSVNYASGAAEEVGQYEAAHMSPTAYDFSAQWVHQDQWLWLGRELAAENDLKQVRVRT